MFGTSVSIVGMKFNWKSVCCCLDGATIEVWVWIRNSTLYNGCNFLSILWLKLIHFSKRGPWLMWDLWPAFLGEVPVVVSDCVGQVLWSPWPENSEPCRLRFCESQTLSHRIGTFVVIWYLSFIWRNSGFFLRRRDLWCRNVLFFYILVEAVSFF